MVWDAVPISFGCRSNAEAVAGKIALNAN